MKPLIIATIISIALFSCSSQEKKESNKVQTSLNQNSGKDSEAGKNIRQIKVSGTSVTKNVDKEEFASLIAKNNGTLLDVRTPEEFRNGNIEGSLNIDINGGDFLNDVKELDPKKPVYVYCHSGGRSGRAMGELKKLGFSEVYNLKGGYSGWTKK